MDAPISYSVFDQVRLRTTKNVDYVSAPPGHVADPTQIWTVTGAIGDSLIVVRQHTVIRIPAADVVMAVKYDITKIVESFRSILDRGEENRGNTT